MQWRRIHVGHSPSRLRFQPERGHVASPVTSSIFSNAPVVGQNIQSVAEAIVCLYSQDLQNILGRSSRSLGN